MISVEFDEIDDPVFPMDEVRCLSGEFMTTGSVELAGFMNHRGSARYRLILKVTEALEYHWDPKDGDGSLILDQVHIGLSEARLVGVIPGELKVTTRALPRVEFLVEEHPFQERRWFRWVDMPEGDRPQ